MKVVVIFDETENISAYRVSNCCESCHMTPPSSQSAALIHSPTGVLERITNREARRRGVGEGLGGGGAVMAIGRTDEGRCCKGPRVALSAAFTRSLTPIVLAACSVATATLPTNAAAGSLAIKMSLFFLFFFRRQNLAVGQIYRSLNQLKSRRRCKGGR